MTEKWPYRVWCREQIALAQRVANAIMIGRAFPTASTERVRELARKAKAEILWKDAGGDASRIVPEQ